MYSFPSRQPTSGYSPSGYSKLGNSRAWLRQSRDGIRGPADSYGVAEREFRSITKLVTERFPKLVGIVAADATESNVSTAFLMQCHHQ